MLVKLTLMARFALFSLVICTGGGCAKKKGTATDASPAAAATTAPTSTLPTLSLDLTGAVGLGVGAAQTTDGSSLALDNSINSIYKLDATGNVTNSLSQTNTNNTVSALEVHKLGGNVVVYLSGYNAVGDLSGAKVVSTGPTTLPVLQEAATSLALSGENISSVTASGPLLSPQQVAADEAAWAASSAPGTPMMGCALGMADATGSISCIDLQSAGPAETGMSYAINTNKMYLQTDSYGSVYFAAAADSHGGQYYFKKFDPKTLKSTPLFTPVASGSVNGFFVNQDSSYLYSVNLSGAGDALYFVNASGSATMVSSDEATFFALMPDKQHIYYLGNNSAGLNSFDLATSTVSPTFAVVVGQQGNTPISGDFYLGLTDFGFTGQMFVGQKNAYALLQNGDNASLQILAQIYPSGNSVDLSTISSIISAKAVGTGLLVVGTKTGSSAVLLSSYDMDSQSEVALVTSSSGLTSISAVSASGTNLVLSGTTSAGPITGAIDLSVSPPSVKIQAASTALSGVAALN